MRPFLRGGLAAALLWAGAVWLVPDAASGRAEREEFLYYPSGAFLRSAVMGYDQAASAVAWIETVQYYGKHARGDQHFDYLYHLCDVTTELDPHFEEPYTFGSFVLLTEGKRPSAGMTLLEKGRENNPESWKIFFETGFTYYIAWKDYPTAAYYFTRAAGMPGAPEVTDRFAAWVSTRAGDVRTAILLWQELADRTTNPELKAKAMRKVQELAAQIQAPGTAGG